MEAKLVSILKVELEGPYECPSCNGHASFDATFLDQVSNVVQCPYCKQQIIIPE